MTMNRVQFQPGLSLPEFYRQFGTEEQCAEALEQARWPEGFRGPHGQSAAYALLRGRPRKTFQCAACRQQTSLIAGLLFQNTHLPLTVWFLALYLVREAKSGLSALALKRHLGGALSHRLAPSPQAFAFKKYGARYLAEAAYRFNRRFRLDSLPQQLLIAAIACPPHTESWLKGHAEESC